MAFDVFPLVFARAGKRVPDGEEMRFESAADGEVTRSAKYAGQNVPLRRPRVADPMAADRARL